MWCFICYYTGKYRLLKLFHKLSYDKIKYDNSWKWIPRERSKRECPRKTWMEGVQAAMTKRNLEPDQWRNGGMAFGFQKTATAVKKIWMNGWMDGWGGVDGRTAIFTNGDTEQNDDESLELN
jgi:hypothetical protein